MGEGVTRRSALAAAGVTVAGGVVGYVVGRNSAAANPPNSTSAANAYGDTPSRTKQALVRLTDVPVGGGVVLTDPAVVITRGTGKAAEVVHAFSSVCTHQGCHVNHVADGRISCPCHGSVFDATTGKVLAGPAPRPLPVVAVTVRGGEVYST